MINMRIAALLLGAAGLVAPAYSQKEPAEQRQNQKAEYHFRKEDGAKLRQHYNNIGRVDVHSRHALVSGGRLPDDWKGRMNPVPADVIRELPPVPTGYVFGYIDGYCVAYDPTTLYIADVIDLTNLP